MHYFFLWNTKDDILKKVDVQTTLAPIDFHCMDKKTFSNHHLWPVLAKWVGMCKVKNVAFTKMSSLSPHLAIPMLHVVMKHLKLSLFVRFLSGLKVAFVHWKQSTCLKFWFWFWKEHAISEHLVNCWGKTSGASFIKLCVDCILKVYICTKARYYDRTCSKIPL